MDKFDIATFINNQSKASKKKTSESSSKTCEEAVIQESLPNDSQQQKELLKEIICLKEEIAILREPLESKFRSKKSSASVEEINEATAQFKGLLNQTSFDSLSNTCKASTGNG
eukprot:TRINITY_DN46518_c0_g1_i1.p1 TRINITY_DN46518_c0_g1~~TRINITY_DN46518_c0_g1_i1.p1  ORF type:complete len:113 (+),score=30.52 TRINITY_DN46518_c0_g1_i1:462-800(+)